MIPAGGLVGGVGVERLASPTVRLAAAVEEGGPAGRGPAGGSGLTTDTRRPKGPGDSGGGGGDRGAEEGWAAHTRPPCCCGLPPSEPSRPTGRPDLGTTTSPTTVFPFPPALPAPRQPIPAHARLRPAPRGRQVSARLRPAPSRRRSRQGRGLGGPVQSSPGVEKAGLQQEGGNH